MFRLCLILLAFMPFIDSAYAVSSSHHRSRVILDPPPVIKVLVESDLNGAVIEVKGRYKLYNPLNNEYLSTQFIGKRKYMKALKNGLMWSEQFPGLHQLLIIPDSKDSSILVDGTEYRGFLYVYSVEGKINIVNALDVEDYVRSVMMDYDTELSSEALAALVIAIRTNAYYCIENPKTSFWAVQASDIGYKGFVKTNDNIALEAALKKTCYLSMAQSDGKASNSFPVQWEQKCGIRVSKENINSKISFTEANALAEKGCHAAQILSKAFPEASLVLKYSAVLK